jgi:hypothetical protein
MMIFFFYFSQVVGTIGFILGIVGSISNAVAVNKVAGISTTCDFTEQLIH